MRRWALVSIAVLVTWHPDTAAQTPIPIREVASPDARSAEGFGAIFGVRQLQGGRVLINDGVRRQLIILDEKFATRTVALDSAQVGGQSYGPRASPLIPYLADSSLFVDGPSTTLLVIDPKGAITRVMSAPKPGDLSSLASSASGVDAKGNLVYRGRFIIAPTMAGAPPGGLPAIAVPDSSPVVRADFDTRKVDTLGRVKIQSGNRAVLSQDANGKLVAKTTINPLNTVDEWGVMSDGTIAFVRGHDYHIDFIHPDGKQTSSAKLPFDWKRLTDEDKQALIDSARAAMEKAVNEAKANAPNPQAAQRAATEAALMNMMSALSSGGMGGGMAGLANITVAGGGRGGEMSIGAGAMPGMGLLAMASPTIVTEYVPLKDIADYYPAIRPGAVKADLDGNLWILPTSSAQSKAGELIYDIVNNRGELTQRVRIPQGRTITGFGHNGVLYLMHRADNGQWFLERARVIGFQNG
ncbi:MAG: hypothetical protein ACO1Q7_11730 [Gemmatimonas sp.]